MIFNTMKFRFLTIVSLAVMTLPVNAEKRLHFDLDYHYNLGLSQRIMGINMSPKDVDYMEGHSLHFALRYDITKRLSAGAGIGIDAYLSGAGNYGKTPLYATCRYKIITDKSFFKGLYGFTNVGYSISGRPLYRGAMFDLGVGWPIMLTKNFGINLQLGYDLSQSKKHPTTIRYTLPSGETIIENTKKDMIRHSLSFGVGITF